VWNDIITAISLIRTIGALVHPVALQLEADAATVRAAKLSFSATCSIHHTHAYLKMHCPLTRASHVPSPSSGSLAILQAVSGLRKRARRHSGSPVQDVSARCAIQKMETERFYALATYASYVYTRFCISKLRAADTSGR